MRVLLDECVRRGVRLSRARGKLRVGTEWRSSKDPTLLHFAERNFDVFVTIDKTLVRENEVWKLKLGIIVVRVPDNTLSSYRLLFDKLSTAVLAVGQGEVVYVGRTAGDRS